MKSLQAPLLPRTGKGITLHDISILLDELKNPIAIAPWPAFPDKPQVTFAIGHCKDHIYIKYDVTEKEVLARYRHINDPVYKDSCVEFFIDFDDAPAYYNIEFNRLGTCLGRYGTDRENRTELPVEILKTIKHERTLKQIKEREEPFINWTLTVSVPVWVFSFHNITSIQHKKCKMNFYKCGDDLSRPHYLAWNNIEWPEPNFHLPRFFGEVEFL
jgi:hypothetical protein